MLYRFIKKNIENRETFFSCTKRKVNLINNKTFCTLDIIQYMNKESYRHRIFNFAPQNTKYSIPWARLFFFERSLSYFVYFFPYLFLAVEMRTKNTNLNYKIIERMTNIKKTDEWPAAIDGEAADVTRLGWEEAADVLVVVLVGSWVGFD